jgi:ubiquinone/menaquinone biosynthesis C-methylase UbiE
LRLDLEKYGNNNMVGYSEVTEISGSKVSREQVQRMYTRYRFASDFSKNKDVLEVACGSGQGLGYLANIAKRVVGVDIDQKLLDQAKKQYNKRGDIQLYQADAAKLPFNENSFDVIIMYEAIYYLPEPEKFICEARRVLRDKGILLVCSANCELSSFNPSPFSFKYFSASGLFDLLNKMGFLNISILGDCKVDVWSLKARVLSFIKKQAVNLHLIPKTMKGKELFKRIFMGELVSMPAEIDDSLGQYNPPVEISNAKSDRLHKVIYSIAYNHK